MRQIFLISIIAVSSLLSACNKAEHTVPYVPNTVRGAAIGAASGAAVGAVGGFAPLGAAIGGVAGTVIGYDYDQREPHYLKLERRLEHIGVQFVRVGEDQRIIIPASRLFYRNSPRLSSAAKSTLDMVIEYVQQYKFLTLNVEGFTDNVGPPKRNQVLSSTQARNVAKYLWRSHFEKRMIFSSGYGSDQPISDNGSKLGRAYNRRIEISFRVMPTDAAES